MNDSFTSIAVAGSAIESPISDSGSRESADHPPPHRYAALDSLRGFASLSVMLFHFSMLTPLLWIRHTPFRLALGGHEAVILFFVLSGYVLTLQISSSTYRYREYLIKRIFRIYLPYIVALAAALAVAMLVPARELGLGLDDSQGKEVPSGTILAHLLVFGTFDSRRINPIVWSLICELRISLVLPFVVAAIIRFGAWRILAATFLGSIAAACAMIRLNQPLVSSSLDASWLATLHYVFIFTCGAALALARRGIMRQFGGNAKILMFGASLVLYVAAEKISSIHHTVIAGWAWDWLIAAAVCGVIQYLVAANPLSKFLSLAPFVLLGRISYSLYLYHIVIMHATIYAFFGLLPLPAVLAISAALSLLVAYVGFIVIEQPSTRLGYVIAHRVRGSDLPRHASA